MADSQLLKNAIDIGSHWEGCTDAVAYLLDPRTTNSDGEWDAWVLRWWKPAEAYRYRSFWELMQAEYQCFVRMQK